MVKTLSFFLDDERFPFFFLFFGSICLIQRTNEQPFFSFLLFFFCLVFSFLLSLVSRGRKWRFFFSFFPSFREMAGTPPPPPPTPPDPGTGFVVMMMVGGICACRGGGNGNGHHEVVMGWLSKAKKNKQCRLGREGSRGWGRIPERLTGAFFLFAFNWEWGRGLFTVASLMDGSQMRKQNEDLGDIFIFGSVGLGEGSMSRKWGGRMVWWYHLAGTL